MEPLPKLSGDSPEGCYLTAPTLPGSTRPQHTALSSLLQGDTQEGQCPPQDQTEPNSSTKCLEKPLPLET